MVSSGLITIGCHVRWEQYRDNYVLRRIIDEKENAEADPSFDVLSGSFGCIPGLFSAFEYR